MSPSRAPLLSVEGLCVGYDADGRSVPLLTDVSLTLEKGERVGLVGASGAGKTLTGLALAGLLPAPLRVTSGRVVIDGTVVPPTQKAWQARRGRDVLVLLQSPLAALDPAASVHRQLADAVAAVRGVRRSDAHARAERALGLAGLGLDHAHLRPWQISGGMRQRALLAFAWALEPRVLVVDEGTSGLDPVRQVGILDALRALSVSRGMALVLISHDLRVVAQLAQRVVVLADGRLAEDASISALLQQPVSSAGRRLASAFHALWQRHPAESAQRDAAQASPMQRVARGLDD